MPRGAKRAKSPPARAKSPARGNAKLAAARKARRTETATRRQLEATLAETAAGQRATSEILRVISSSRTDVQPVFDAIVRSAVELCRGVFSILLTFDGELLHFVAHHNFGPEALAVYRQWFPRRAADDRIAGRAVRERQVVNVPDVTAVMRFVPGQREQGFRSVLFVPMLRDGDEHRGDRRLSPGSRGVPGQAGRASPDLRRPGRHRHRERAPVQGAGGPQP